VNIKDEEVKKLLTYVSEDEVWRECTPILKDYFNSKFLLDLKENKTIIFKLYKLFLVDELYKDLKLIEEK
jgi:hypothetical protein